MPSVFLSYSHSDKEIATRIATDLKKFGVRVWVAEWEIKIGDSLIGKIREAIDKMDYLGVLLSPSSVNSEWVKKEVDVAMNQEIEGKQVRVLPLLIKDCELPGFMKGKLYADFRDENKYYFALKLILDRFGIQFDLEDPEVKFLQDQLDAYQKAYLVNKTLINEPILFAKIYRNRRKIRVDEDKYVLILGSILLNEMNSGWYFLRDIEQPKIRELLKELLNHPFYLMRKKALDFLSERITYDDREMIFRLIQDPELVVRTNAAKELSKIALPEDRETILKLLQNKSQEIKNFAAAALVKIDLPEDIESIGKMIHDFRLRDSIIEALAEKRDKKTIIKLLKDPDQSVRRRAIGALSQIALPEDRETILKLLQDEDFIVILCATYSLARIALPQDREIILKLLQNHDSNVRELAVDAMARIGEKETIIKLLQNPDGSIRFRAVTALVEMVSQDDKETLLKLIKDTDSLIRWGAASALVKIADKETLLKLIKDPDSCIQRKAANALVKVADKETLLKLIKDKEPFTHSIIVAALRKISDKEIVLKLLQDPDNFIRGAAVEVLGDLSSPQDNEIIFKMLQDINPFVQDSAITALEKSIQRLGDEEAEIVLDYLAAKVQSWNKEQTFFLGALSKVDRILYSPVKHLVS